MLTILKDVRIPKRQPSYFIPTIWFLVKVLHLYPAARLGTLSLHNRHSVDVIYFDFTKAFDSVSHLKLLHKLQAYGFCGDLLRILANFLQDRTQRVVLPNGTSQYCSVISGVPQGSCRHVTITK